eukprot:TRINITY_DN3710_c0_g2_i3.p1 TRINITY_DN3710_c0_g2~~TRINITY_DN3710_c0_g2_i3.p1  ORF type:complete len:380 (+),score=122.77 TRINITY_DN3710_c0_g2_i3:65-1141(+)
MDTAARRLFAAAACGAVAVRVGGGSAPAFHDWLEYSMARFELWLWGVDEVPLLRSRAISHYGLPEAGANVLHRAEYACCVDNAMRCPRWVMEHHNRHVDRAAGEKRPGRKRPRFAGDPDVDTRFRAIPADYRKSGYDIGHLFAFADSAAASRKELAESFLLTNTVPQNPTLNRGLWRALEAWARGLVGKAAAAEVWVVSGPLFLPDPWPEETRKARSREVRIQRIGSTPGVAVPTHLFKVVLARAPDGTVRAASFVLPNAPAEGSLTDYRVPVRDIERVAGFSFFPKLPVPIADVGDLSAVPMHAPAPRSPKRLEDLRGEDVGRGRRRAVRARAAEPEQAAAAAAAPAAAPAASPAAA